MFPCVDFEAYHLLLPRILFTDRRAITFISESVCILDYYDLCVPVL